MQAIISKRLLSSPEAQPRAKPVEIRDTRLKGFVLRIQPSGSMTYYAELGRGNRKRIGAVGEFTPDEARERATKMLANTAQGKPAHHGIRGAGTGMTLGEFIEQHYEPHAVKHLRSWASSKNTLDTQFDAWKGLDLTEITTEMIMQWKNKRVAEGRPDTTVLRNLASLASVLSYAVLLEKLDASPVPPPKRLLIKLDRRPNVRYLAGEEERRLRAALADRDKRLIAARDSGNEWSKERGRPQLPRLMHFGDHLTPVVLLSMNTGLRRGELMRLTWDSIDLRARRVTLLGKTTKNSQTRHVPLNDEATDILRRWREQSPKGAERPFPFATSFKTAFKKLLRAARIKDFRWHDLRHHFASRLVQEDVSLNTVRELLGQVDDRTVLRYAHIAPRNLTTAVAKLDRKRASR